MENRTFHSVYELTEAGLSVFEGILEGRLADDSLRPTESIHAKLVAGTEAFEARNFGTAKEMAAEVCKSLGQLTPQDVVGRTGIWAWYTFVLRDCLFPAVKGVRKTGSIHRWYPSSPGDFQKAQRHLVRMPALLYSSLGNDADHLLYGKPGVGTDIREQLTSQQDMMSANFQRVARRLYFDDATGTAKRGAGSRNRPGVPYRLAMVRKQLDVTWDMTDLDDTHILKLLPPEFSAFLE